MGENFLQQGIELMIYGMGIVFIFLTLLVGVTITWSAVVSRFIQEEPATVAKQATATSGSTGIDDNTVAAISAAIHQHRQRK